MNFSHLISSVSHLISENMNQSLCKVVFIEEILKAVKQLGPLKRLGRMDIQISFFEKYWDIVGAQVCLAVREFFTIRV